MKVIKEEMETRNWVWFKTFEKRLLVNLLKAQDFLITWRASLCSREFWNLSWLWMAFLMKLCSLRITFSVGQGHRKNLMSWVSSHVPKHYLEGGFPDCFKNGILLCALTEKLVNGACPRYDLLDPDQPARNLKWALYLIEKHIKIKPVVTADEILQGGKSLEKRLMHLIAHMKLASERLNLSANSLKLHQDYMSQTTFVSDKCFARGMGLLLAVKGRKACFCILLDSTDNLDMVIEIRGPKNTACNKRITSVYSLTSSDSPDIRDVQDAQIQQDILSKKIPLSYSILGRKIVVSYTPLESGTHHMSIIWQGQHIMGSPYTITVDSSVDTPDIWYHTPNRGHNKLKRTDSQCYDESVDYRKDASCSESTGTITRKRILQYIVKIDGNDVVIDGKEDLCKSIKYIKQQQQNLSSKTEESFEFLSRTGSDFFSKSELENIQNSISETDNVSLTGYDISSEQDFRDASPVVNKKDIAINPDSRCKVSPLLNIYRADASEYSNGVATTRSTYFDNSKDENSEREKAHFNTDITLNNDFEIPLVNESFHEEHFEAQTSNTEGVREVNNRRINVVKNPQKGQKPKVKVSVLDEKVEESGSPFSTRDFSNNNLNLNVGDLTPQTDDFNFFPVHKVEYEILRDDDEDYLEVPGNCNQKRRTSFTELHESNYLEEDVIETEVVDNGFDNTINSGIEREEDYQGENEVVYRNELKVYDGTDIRNCLRANHSLFQCDHSLSLFTETVIETPPELATSENERENTSDHNIINPWEYEIQELKDEPDNGNMEHEPCSSDEGINLEYADMNPFIATFNEAIGFEDSDPFSSQCTILNNFECEEFDPNKKANLQDLADKRKRLSWSDRDILPCIRESSIEGLLESETQDDKIRNREISEKNSYICDTKAKNNPDSQNDTISSKMHQNVSKFDERFEKPLTSSTYEGFQPSCDTPESRMDYLNDTHSNTHSSISLGSFGRKTEVSSKNESVENLSKRTLSSMNILSASPYKSRGQSNKHSEIKFSTGTYLEKPTSQITTTTQTTTLSNSQNMADTFILTYATPAIVEECQNESEVPKQVQEEFKENIHDKSPRLTDYSDSSEQKTAQCLSVKKVIQIFQKEKEEPVDTWPSETMGSPCCRKKFKDDILSSKVKEKIESLESENCLLTPSVEMSRSSIKDRVKLFENEERKTPSVRKHSNVERRASSSISAKKDYWESFAS